MKTYSGTITKLLPNQIAVAGTNPQGRHGLGFAKWCAQNAGLIYGKATGLIGQTYGIVTKDISVKPHRSIPKVSIIQQIAELYRIAKEELPNKDFLIPYNTTTPNLNFYSAKEMALMFNSAGMIPGNIVFEENFAKLVQQSNCLF